MAIYMEFEGIKGSVSATGHEKWIELVSCQVGVARSITSPTGVGTNRESSTPMVSEIVVSKTQDAASTGLFKASLWGTGKLVKIDFVRTNKDKFDTYLQFVLQNALISSYSVSGMGGDNHTAPMESLSLNFTKIDYSTTLADDKNTGPKPERASWDLSTGKGS